MSLSLFHLFHKRILNELPIRTNPSKASSSNFIRFTVQHNGVRLNLDKWGLSTTRENEIKKYISSKNSIEK